MNYIDFSFFYSDILECSCDEVFYVLGSGYIFGPYSYAPEIPYTLGPFSDNDMMCMEFLAHKNMGQKYIHCLKRKKPHHMNTQECQNRKMKNLYNSYHHHNMFQQLYLIYILHLHNQVFQ
jgi:hypothetical protein